MALLGLFGSQRGHVIEHPKEILAGNLLNLVIGISTAGHLVKYNSDF